MNSRRQASTRRADRCGSPCGSLAGSHGASRSRRGVGVTRRSMARARGHPPRLAMGSRTTSPGGSPPAPDPRVLHPGHDLSAFYSIAADDPQLAWAATGAGRMLRSPTVFEDVVKTLCTTNCSWGLTVTMVNALVTNLGESPAGARDPLRNAFPTAEAMAAQDERFFRDVVRSGYRAPRFIELAELQATGAIDLEALGAATREDIPDEEIERQLLALPGIGPYAAAHVMMTIGRNSKLILDSWTRPKYARVTGARRQPADAQIIKRFRRYGPEAGLAFWLVVTQDWVHQPAG